MGKGGGAGTVARSYRGHNRGAIFHNFVRLPVLIPQQSVCVCLSPSLRGITNPTFNSETVVNPVSGHWAKA